MAAAESRDACSRALKEWAVQCLALGLGRRSVIVRKGGLRETAGEFAVSEPDFWLYPTGFHQSAAQLVPELADLAAAVAADVPPPGEVPLRWHARVVRTWRLTGLEQALRIEPWQCLSAETLAARFTYRQPGLWVLLLEVTPRAEVAWVTESATMRGCHSWVDLERPVTTACGPPVVPVAELGQLAERLDELVRRGGPGELANGCLN